MWRFFFKKKKENSQHHVGSVHGALVSVMCDVVLSSTAQHDDHVDPSTREPDEQLSEQKTATKRTSVVKIMDAKKNKKIGTFPGRMFTLDGCAAVSTGVKTFGARRLAPKPTGKKKPSPAHNRDTPLLIHSDNVMASAALPRKTRLSSQLAGLEWRRHWPTLLHFTKPAHAKP